MRTTARGRLLRTLSEERGAGSVEYAGIGLVVASLLGAAVLAPATDVISPAVARSVCQAFDALPGVSTGCGGGQDAVADSRVEDMLEDCVVRRTDRANSLNAQVKIVRGERGNGDVITRNADGSASVNLNESTGVGVSAPTRGNKLGEGTHSSGASGGADFSAYAMGMGELEYTYNFPTSVGGADAAQSFLDDRRGVGDQIIDTVVPGAQTAREGLTRGGDATANFFEDAGRWVVRQELSDQEREHRAAQQHAGHADTVSAALSIQGLVGVSGEVGYGEQTVASGSAEVSGSMTGRVSTSLNNTGDQAGSNSFEGALRYDLAGEATVGLQFRDGDALAGLPPFLNFGGMHGGTYTYQVDYDSDGEPVRLTFTGETRNSAKVGIQPTVGPFEIGGQPFSGTLNQEVRVLDLTDPAARTAFDNVFLTTGVNVADSSAQISVPVAVPTAIDSQGFTDFVLDTASLWALTETDGVIYNYDYDMYGLGAAGKYTNEQGVGARLASAGFSHTEQTIVLTSAEGRDTRTGEPAVTLAACEG